jgi:hypothetical protein
MGKGYRVSRLAGALRAASAAALIGGFAVAGAAPASADPNTGSSADINTLAGSLSKGYGLNICKAQPVTEKGELAEIQCGQSPDSSGPVTAQYALFSNGTDMAAAFTDGLKNATPVTCSADTRPSPTTWSQSGQTGGQLACLTNQNAVGVLWTIDSKNVVGQILAQGTDVGPLYKWWQSNG